jgi:hypothetical protein
MANGSSKRGDAVTDRELESWSKIETELTEASRRRKAAAAQRELAMQADEPPAWEEEDERSSVTIEAPPDVLRRGFIVRGVQSMRPVIESVVPASVRQRMASPKGKLVALLTLVFSALVAAVMNELAKRGVAGP